MNKFKLSISTYLAILMGAVIMVATFILVFIAMGNINNLVGEYESDTKRLKNYLATILTYTVKQDIKNNNFAITKNMLDFYKSESLLSYIYIKNDKNEKIILGHEDNEKEINVPSNKEISISIGDYTF